MHNTASFCSSESTCCLLDYIQRQGERHRSVAAHTSFVSERCAEVSLHVRYGQRSRAVAARFELIRDRWQVSALEFA
jgi:hypothetical protein